MVGKVELIPLWDGNRITVKENEKVIVGRGSSLGCNEKKISRHHAELLLKDDNTLWITPTHTNPVFYRPYNSKTIILPKDIERELKDGDQIGLLPSSFFFRVSFSIDLNNNNDNDDSEPDSLFAWKKEEKTSPVHTTSLDNWSPTRGVRRSLSTQDTSVFDFDDDIIIEPTRTPCRRISFDKKTSTDEKKVSPDEKKVSSDEKKVSSDEKKVSSDEKKVSSDEKKVSKDVEPKPRSPMTFPSITLTRVSVPSPSADDQDGSEPQSPSMADDKTRKLPKWMAGTTPSPVVKQTTTTPKSPYSRTSSTTTPTRAKRHLSFEGDSNGEVNEASNISDVRSPATPTETKSPGKVLSRISSTKNFDNDSGDEMESITPKTPTPKKLRPGGRRRPICQFGATCYRKNPSHRAEHSHPGDDDYDPSKQTNDVDMNDDNEPDKPDCPFGKSCYRQNPQHKRDFKH